MMRHDKLKLYDSKLLSCDVNSSSRRRSYHTVTVIQADTAIRTFCIGLPLSAAKYHTVDLLLSSVRV